MVSGFVEKESEKGELDMDKQKRYVGRPKWELRELRWQSVDGEAITRLNRILVFHFHIPKVDMTCGGVERATPGPTADSTQPPPAWSFIKQLPDNLLRTAPPMNRDRLATSP